MYFNMLQLKKYYYLIGCRFVFPKTFFPIILIAFVLRLNFLIMHAAWDHRILTKISRNFSARCARKHANLHCEHACMPCSCARTVHVPVLQYLYEFPNILLSYNINCPGDSSVFPNSFFPTILIARKGKCPKKFLLQKHFRVFRYRMHARATMRFSLAYREPYIHCTAVVIRL